ncbi:flagellar filament capping protein FliD [Nevskia soli]|uniref:flagellar filament capping protein FliD n=1 Tax=Nevskia soli TaxID=418856 RepID=UPI00068DAD2E|nr:flagellar filament capping protein FliD [Nevskia soli]
MTVSLSTTGTASAGTVTSQGIGSGIDIASLVSSLVTSTIKPQQTLLQNNQAADQSTISALGALKSALSSLQTTVDAITTGGALSKFTTQSSDNSVFTATTSSGAVAGSYQMQIQTVAQVNTLRSTAFSSSSAAVGTGPYTFTAGGKSFSVTLDGTNDTLSGLASAINGASDNSGVSATIVNGSGGSYLLLSATQTGIANAVSVASSAPIGFSSIQSASDASGTIDGLPFDSASNTISNVLTGVTLSLASAAPNTTQTLTIGADTQSAATAVQSFVTAYNAALSLITSDTAFTPGSSTSGSGSSTGTAGPLLGDLAVESVSRQLESIVGGSAGSGGNAFTLLSQIGVTTNDDGTLAVNSDTLNSALQQNSSAVKGLFSGTNGIGTQLDTLLNTVVGAGGLISTKTSALQTEVDSMTTQLTQLTAKSAQLTAQYNAQFNAMDSIVAAYKNTASLLTQLYAPRTTSSSSSGS